MKRDGDVKLASLSPHAAVILEMTRTDRLFEVYETASDAVRSFSGFLPNAMREHRRWGTVTTPLSVPPTQASEASEAAASSGEIAA